MCVVGAVNDGKCSLRWSATVSVVQESMWWKGNQIRDSNSEQVFLFHMQIYSYCFYYYHVSMHPTFFTLLTYLRMNILLHYFRFSVLHLD